MLSSQTKDPVVGAAMRRLQEQLKPDGLTLDNVRNASERDIRDLIYGVGFQNKKAVYIKNAAEMIAEEFEGKVPSTFRGLVQLPGVGPKMALIVLNAAFEKCEGVSIDTHLHRMCRQLGWARKECKNPEHTRRDLESWLPRKYWSTMNLIWVGIGQEVQTQQGKLIKKALHSSDPAYAIRVLRKLFGGSSGLSKAAKRADIDLPSSV